MTIVGRTCTEVRKGQGRLNSQPVSNPLSEYRSEPAYVLLGDPGAGKSTSFREERKRTPAAAEKVIEARDFITFDVADHPEWRNRTLFIDGLDEIRAGSLDGRTALDKVRSRLHTLGKPRFRLSCREADWLGPNDWTRLQEVAPGRELTVLRLDALTLDDAHRIAEASSLVEDAGQFMQEAGERGLQELLLNPQSLELLIEVVCGAGQWPKSRLGVFDLACQRLAKEENEEHRYSLRDPPNEDQVIKDAGRICALLLLSGTPGVNLLPPGEEHHVDYPQVQRFDPIPEGTTAGESEVITRRRRLVLSSRLFRVVGGSYPAGQRFEPVHRHIAEFLAGRYLAQQIRTGLPAARVLALITARDGGVVTAHRGLSGWLAAHSRAARQELLDRDPIGVGLYGDISGFAIDEKRALLQALIREGGRLHEVGYRSIAAFAPLATPSLEGVFREKLTVRPRGDDDQLAADFVLRVLCLGAPLPALVEPLLAIVNEPEWWPRVSRAALDAYIHQCEDREIRIAKLQQVLTSVQAGTVPDPDNQLAVTILDQLYPDTIPPTRIWTHLDRCQPTKLYGRHRVFWTRTLEARTSDEDLALLLDALVRERPDLRLVNEGLPHGRALAERLLSRGLSVHGDELTPRRLHEWLGAPARTYLEFHELGQSPSARESAFAVRSWLQEHPHGYKSALLEGLRGYEDEEDLHARWVLTRKRLREAQPPADFGFWCLNQAQELAQGRPELARWLFMQANWRLRNGESAQSQELLDECVAAHPSLAPAVPKPEAIDELQELERRHESALKARLEEQKRENRERLGGVRKEATALRQNRGAPVLLHSLALEWFQGAPAQASSLSDWLHTKFGAEHELAEAALTALRGTFERDDLPDVDEILRLAGESRMHYLALPLLAALKDRELNENASLDDLTEKQWCLALAVHYLVPTDLGAHPDWYRRLVARRPDLVASVLLPLARTELRRGSEHVPGLSELAHESGHADLARLLSLTLLRSFPLRSRTRQLRNLSYLLWAALQHTDRNDLLSLTGRKLGRTSMTVSQRVLWLAAGFVAAPEAYGGPLEIFVSGKELRARQLADFLWSDYQGLFRPKDLPPSALETLVRLLGRAFGTYELEDGIVDSPQLALQQIPELIRHLSASPEPEATDALHRLAEDPALSAWRYHLLMASDKQAIVSRDNSYNRPELEAVRATLDNATPANAADLAALALARLDQLAKQIRHTDTDDWEQYWNQKGHKSPNSSKPENACRNSLLRGLRALMPDEVVVPEGQHASGRRSDILLARPDFRVPIEIKKQSNPELWRAARDQLVAKYAQDSATDGYGIYVVLWFGEPEKTQPDETGTRPASPEELRQRLEAGITRQLAPEQARKIGVRVINVSKP